MMLNLTVTLTKILKNTTKDRVSAKGYVELTSDEIANYEVEDWELDWLLHNKAVQQAKEKGAVAEITKSALFN